MVRLEHNIILGYFGRLWSAPDLGFGLDGYSSPSPSCSFEGTTGLEGKSASVVNTLL